MNGFLALMQQFAPWTGTQAAALWNVASAIAANRPAPARTVVVYTLALAVLLAFAPKIIKKVAK